MRRIVVAVMALLMGCGSSGGRDEVVAGGASTSFMTSSTTSSSSTSTSTTTTTVPCNHLEPTITNHVYATYPGVGDRFTSFDLYLPAGCGPFPVLVWVHGGAWVGGDKANPEALDRASYAFSLGYALASTNYRLANKFGKGFWPDYPNDVADAVAHIVGNADTLLLDAERISLLGHSAGGHTVTILSADRSYMSARGLADTTLDCVIANDTVGYRLADRATSYPIAVDNAFGTDPEVLADASPSVRVEREGAPATRYLIITRGSAQHRAVEFADLVVAAGGDASVLFAGDYSHEKVNQVLGEPNENVITPTVSEFLRRCLTPSVR